MNPISKYLKNLFASKKVIGDDSELSGLVKADMLLNNLVNEKVPGLAITVMHKGEILFQKGFGYADLESKVLVDPRKTIFRIASVSKPIAATALAHMVDDGIIDLDTSFYQYVPYFPKKQWDFTIRQLASHTAGIRGYQGTEYGLNKQYSIKDSLEIFAEDELLFEPGTDYLYNSYDWVMISLAMQEASGIPFEEYVQEKVLNPLALTNTFAEIQPEHIDGLLNFSKAKNNKENTANFYSKNRLGFRKAIPVNNYYKLAGGGYLSTTEDIAKFGQAYLDSKVLTEDALFPFLTSQTVHDKKTYYGLGWQVSEDANGRNYFGHIGNGVGGYSNFFIYPNEELVFVALTNCTNPGIQEELDEIRDILLQNLAFN